MEIFQLIFLDYKFQEMTIVPSDRHLFPEYDWLIGNHSDELTPWIPVIASRYVSQICYINVLSWKFWIGGKWLDFLGRRIPWSSFCCHAAPTISAANIREAMDRKLSIDHTLTMWSTFLKFAVSKCWRIKWESHLQKGWVVLLLAQSKK